MEKDKLAEEIALKFKIDTDHYADQEWDLERVVQAEQAYREAKMKEELIQFMEFLTIDKYQDNPDIDLIDEYLKQRNK